MVGRRLPRFRHRLILPVHTETYSAADSTHAQRALAALPEVGRALPHSLEAEEALLALLIAYPDEVFPLCRNANFDKNSFYDPKHGTIYAAVRTLGIAQHPIDIATVAERLRETGDLERIGSYAVLTQITTSKAPPRTPATGSTKCVNFGYSARPSAGRKRRLRIATGIQASPSLNSLRRSPPGFRPPPRARGRGIAPLSRRSAS